MTVHLGGICFNLTFPRTCSSLSALRRRDHHDLGLFGRQQRRRRGRLRSGRLGAESRWKALGLRWLRAGGQRAPSSARRPARQSATCAFCPRGGLGISANPARRLAYRQLFSAPTRPTSPDTLPFPARRAQDGLLPWRSGASWGAQSPSLRAGGEPAGCRSLMHTPD